MFEVTFRQLNSASTGQAKSMEKLSSGLRINKAGDDAAGLAISEKMRAQVRGLDMAAKNSQDGVSMLQTAEGALNETHDILQRMRELATQAANDTNTDTDRGEIQKEINQLTSEINRIGNTTEFNTQSLLKGDGKSNLDKSGLITDGKLKLGSDASKTQATQTTTLSAAAEATDTATFTLNGIDLTVTFTASASNGSAAGDNQGYNVTGTTADVAIDASPSTGNAAAGLRDALTKMIDANDQLKGNYKVSGTGDDITITAVKGGKFDGAAGVIGASTLTDNTTGGGSVTTFAGTGGAANTGTGGAANTGTDNAAQAASMTLDFTSGGLNVASSSDVEKLVGTGMTINGQQIEFYDATKGSYTGEAIGINISDAVNATQDWDEALATTLAAQIGEKVDGVDTTVDTAGKLTISAAEAGAAGNDIEVKDGGIQEAFKAKFQVGANQNQSMTIDINDMRAEALKLSGKSGEGNFTASNNVTDGTDNNSVEAALDVSTHEKAASAITVINKAIETVSAERSKLGAFSNRLDHTINNLGTSSENLTAAESRIRDVDMAKEMMSQTKNSILSQAAQAMLAQANQQPQGVLQLLR
ncbi:flagellin [Cytobacillus firmus]|uniref:flagellin N-terminal helical domain-containing protein n=1 Tax=Cytobacillus firmus TaxID=1399 RepID=UPI0018CE2667|nr:flagellin [Cytobacillus firmus]MBG9444640.1 flagellin protein [Cytobacillus firmus]